MVNTTEVQHPANEGESKDPIQKPSSTKKPLVSSIKSAIIGGISASAVTLMLANPSPTPASASVLIPSLTTIANLVTTYLDMFTDFVDNWIPNIGAIIDQGFWNNMMGEQKTLDEIGYGTVRDMAEYHSAGEGVYFDNLSEMLRPLRNDDGKIDPIEAAKRLAPPIPLGSGDINDDAIREIWDHAVLMTGDEPMPEVVNSAMDTLRGIEYEYDRLQIIQSRLLAQDAIQRYPMSGAKLEGYREHVAQVSDHGTLAGMTPGQLVGAQLDMQAKVHIPAAIDQLESTLRQERMLGALLAQEIKPQAMQLINNSVVTQ